MALWGRQHGWPWSYRLAAQSCTRRARCSVVYFFQMTSRRVAEQLCATRCYWRYNGRAEPAPTSSHNGPGRGRRPLLHRYASRRHLLNCRPEQHVRTPGTARRQQTPSVPSDRGREPGAGSWAVRSRPGSPREERRAHRVRESHPPLFRQSRKASSSYPTCSQLHASDQTPWRSFCRSHPPSTPTPLGADRAVIDAY